MSSLFVVIFVTRSYHTLYFVLSLASMLLTLKPESLSRKRESTQAKTPLKRDEMGVSTVGFIFLGVLLFFFLQSRPHHIPNIFSVLLTIDK